MNKLESLLRESKETAEKMQELKNRLQVEISRAVYEVTGLPDGVVFHDMLIEMALADIDCGEHFSKRYTDDTSRASQEAAEDWKRCHNRSMKAIDAFRKIAKAYIKIPADVMDE